MESLPKHLKASKAVRHALQVREAVNLGNYHTAMHTHTLSLAYSHSPTHSR